MDGLLIDSERYMWTVSMTQAMLERGLVLTDEFHKTIMGLTLDTAAPLIKNEYGQTFDTNNYFNRVKEINREIIKKGVPLKKGARELLNYLHLNNIKTCIGTSTTREEAIPLLEADNLLNDFDEIVCGDEVCNGKPAPDIYLKCFNKFNFEKTETLILEDANAGAKAAIASGIRLILVPDLSDIEESVKNKAYKVVGDLSKVIDIIKEENERTISI